MWAREVVSRALGRPVHVHDDGSQPAMFDLRIGPAHAPEIAIEVAGAVDPIFTETWNVGPARGPIQVEADGDWLVVVRSGADLRAIRSARQGLAQVLRSQRLTTAVADQYAEGRGRTLSRYLESLGIDRMDCLSPEGTGKVHLTMPGRAGVVDTAGITVPPWIEAFLSDPARTDIISKLRAAGATTAEVFAAVTMDGAPWGVVSYLTSNMDDLPPVAPVLPDGINGFWACPTHGRHGLHWDGQTWWKINIGV